MILYIYHVPQSTESIVVAVFTYTVGTYSPGKVLLTCAIIIQVFPTVPSPIVTHLTCLSEVADIFLSLSSLSSLLKQLLRLPSIYMLYYSWVLLTVLR